MKLTVALGMSMNHKKLYQRSSWPSSGICDHALEEQMNALRKSALSAIFRTDMDSHRLLRF